MTSLPWHVLVAEGAAAVAIALASHVTTAEAAGLGAAPAKAAQSVTLLPVRSPQAATSARPVRGAMRAVVPGVVRTLIHRLTGNATIAHVIDATSGAVTGALGPVTATLSPPRIPAGPVAGPAGGRPADPPARVARSASGLVSGAFGARLFSPTTADSGPSHTLRRIPVIPGGPEPWSPSLPAAISAVAGAISATNVAGGTAEGAWTLSLTARHPPPPPFPVLQTYLPSLVERPG